MIFELNERKTTMPKKIIATNKKAFHEYFILDRFSAGIVLTGTEIKSVRASKVNLKDSFAKIENNELFIYKMHISQYEQGNRYNHEPERTRKLLLTKKELKKLIGKSKESNLTIVPIELFIQDGWAKLEIATAKGKKLHDKRADIAKKDQNREIERATKSRY